MPDRLFQQMIESSEKAEAKIASALEVTSECPGNLCPVCHVVANTLQAMLESLRAQRHQTAALVLMDPIFDCTNTRDHVVATISRCESYATHVHIYLMLIEAAHGAFDAMADGRIDVILETHGDSVRAAAEALIHRCDKAEVTAEVDEAIKTKVNRSTN